MKKNLTELVFILDRSGSKRLLCAGKCEMSSRCAMEEA